MHQVDSYAIRALNSAHINSRSFDGAKAPVNRCDYRRRRITRISISRLVVGDQPCVGLSVAPCTPQSAPCRLKDSNLRPRHRFSPATSEVAKCFVLLGGMSETHVVLFVNPSVRRAPGSGPPAAAPADASNETFNCPARRRAANSSHLPVSHLTRPTPPTDRQTDRQTDHNIFSTHSSLLIAMPTKQLRATRFLPEAGRDEKPRN
uniref:Uncharacterized protein n=1 Tax=Plectus sambesii TaxID=2011161 RepID=A0A914V4U0_9BILA